MAKSQMQCKSRSAHVCGTPSPLMGSKDTNRGSQRSRGPAKASVGSERLLSSFMHRSLSCPQRSFCPRLARLSRDRSQPRVAVRWSRSQRAPVRRLAVATLADARATQNWLMLTSNPSMYDYCEAINSSNDLSTMSNHDDIKCRHIVISRPSCSARSARRPRARWLRRLPSRARNRTLRSCPPLNEITPP
jgi:hypothetical protein